MSMSNRLQILVPKKDFFAVRVASRLEGKSVSEWVRDLIRDHLSARTKNLVEDPIQLMDNLSLPAPSLDQMLKEIEQGRQ